MIKLYHILPDNDPMGGSRNAAKVSIALRELGEKPEVIDLSREKDCRPPDSDFRKLNPNGVTPAIDEDGFVLWESTAILRYLADTRGKFLPGDVKKKGTAQQWMAWEGATFQPSLLGVFFLALAGDTDSDQAKQAAQALQGNLKILDNALAGKEFLAGEYSIADMALGSVVPIVTRLGISLKPFSNIVAWLGRLQARPAWQGEKSFTADMGHAKESGLV